MHLHSWAHHKAVVFAATCKTVEAAQPGRMSGTCGEVCRAAAGEDMHLDMHQHVQQALAGLSVNPAETSAIQSVF